MSTQHISESLPLPSGMRSRGNLPRRICATCAEHNGRGFVWSDSRGVYVAEDGSDLVALPWMVRRLWGATFWPADLPIYIDGDGAVLEVAHAKI